MPVRARWSLYVGTILAALVVAGPASTHAKAPWNHPTNKAGKPVTGSGRVIQTPLLHSIRAFRAATWREQGERCRSRTPLDGSTVAQKPLYRVKAWNRPRVLRAWMRWHRQARSQSSYCFASRAWAWYYSGSTQCVCNREGGWSSVNPAGPYYGRFQMDASFQRAYGPEYVARYGTGVWSDQTAQVVTAYRGWLARGWSPWPNTARACGLR